MALALNCFEREVKSPEREAVERGDTAKGDYYEACKGRPSPKKDSKECSPNSREKGSSVEKKRLKGRSLIIGKAQERLRTERSNLLQKGGGGKDPRREKKRTISIELSERKKKKEPSTGLERKENLELRRRRKATNYKEKKALQNEDQDANEKALCFPKKEQGLFTRRKQRQKGEEKRGLYIVIKHPLGKKRGHSRGGRKRSQENENAAASGQPQDPEAAGNIPQTETKKKRKEKMQGGGKGASNVKTIASNVSEKISLRGDREDILGKEGQGPAQLEKKNETKGRGDINQKKKEFSLLDYIGGEKKKLKDKMEEKGKWRLMDKVLTRQKTAFKKKPVAQQDRILSQRGRTFLKNTWKKNPHQKEASHAKGSTGGLIKKGDRTPYLTEEKTEERNRGRSAAV